MHATRQVQQLEENHIHYKNGSNNKLKRRTVEIEQYPQEKQQLKQYQDQQQQLAATSGIEPHTLKVSIAITTI